MSAVDGNINSTRLKERVKGSFLQLEVIKPSIQYAVSSLRRSKKIVLVYTLKCHRPRSRGLEVPVAAPHGAAAPGRGRGRPARCG